MAVDKGRVIILLLLDLSAAFDTIDHKILLTLLKDHFGIDGTVLHWLSSYLTDRTQSVHINLSSSTISSLKYGVPQGSILGSLLFCVYMTPLGQIIRKCNMSLHILPDDTQIYCFFEPKLSTSRDSSLLNTQKCVEEIHTWMSPMKLKLNDDKTEFLVISSPSNMQYTNDLTIQIGDATKSPSKCS